MYPSHLMTKVRTLVINKALLQSVRIRVLYLECATYVLFTFQRSLYQRCAEFFFSPCLANLM